MNIHRFLEIGLLGSPENWWTVLASAWHLDYLAVCEIDPVLGKVLAGLILACGLCVFASVVNLTVEGSRLGAINAIASY